jgi:4-hydroxybenzoate polyprenyltransferase
MRARMGSGGGGRTPLLVLGQVHLPTLLVPVGPFFIGWVLASEALLPTGLDFWLALASMLPFLGLGTVLVNDAYDAPVDALSRRKGHLPASTGRLGRGTLLGAAAAMFAAALALAWAVNTAFLAAMAALVLLALLYSVPPVQLSRRAGLDLAANSLGIGVVCTVAGWAVERGASLPPAAWLVTSALGTGTFFMLPTLMDHASDLAGGKLGTVVRLGWRRACYLGMALIALADVGIVYMSLGSVILRPSFLYVAWAVILGELVVFPLLARRQDLVRPLTASMAGLLFAGNLLIMLSYLGALGPF